jgi:hypothetical protein
VKKKSVIPKSPYVKTLLEFPVMYSGWECDEKGWVKERADGIRVIVLTDHGVPYEADPKVLRDRMDAYRDALAKSREALDLLS